MRHILYITISILIFYFLFQNFLSFILTERQKFFFFLLLCAIHFILTPFLSQSYIFVLLGCVGIFIYKLSPNPATDIFCMLLGYFYNVSLNALLLTFYTRLTGNSLYQEQYPLFFSVFYLLIVTFTSRLLGQLLHKRLKIKCFIFNKHLSIPICINLILCTFLCVFNIIWGEKIGYNPKNIFFNTVIFLTYFVITTILLFQLYAYAKKEAHEKYTEEKYRLLSLYTKELEMAYGNTKKIKHDYDNILLSLSEYIKQHRYEELLAYYQNEILPFTNQNHTVSFDFSELSLIHIPEIKSLLIAKLLEGNSQNLQIHLEVKNEFFALPVPILDFIRVLGIFLDNALEAAQESNEKMLDIAVIQGEKTITFIISNSTLPLPAPIQNLNQKGYSSKGEERGLGLYNATEIINKYPSILWTSKYKEPIFTQIIEIEVNTDDSHLHMRR